MYEALASVDGARFRKECKDAGKSICAWTVNSKEEMRQCARWEIMSIISDKPDQWRDIKKEVSVTSLVWRTMKLMKDYGQPFSGVETDSCNLHPALHSYQKLVFQLRKSSYASGLSAA